MAQVAAYKASGLKASVWAQANGVSIRDLSSWCAHAQRWQARLDGVEVAKPGPKVDGFVAARLPVASATTVRIELHAGSTRLELHWPVANARELAAWLREVGR
ncbi:IS66 family insertion sequence element accessory protein TnpB [Roseateles saccharophilus]|uniref:IS66 family insertion sequence element accessory protein TnpB n=2 Tax=Roseateles saccharophilus TaxID=304 RepID=UPI001048E8A6|nr:IS66 family insertion sequence element accessory protein TnpB [Roseateles saccharophilus]MDG0836304.1 IS66 family insertion sequence hypothetical protein [Roseateles saccharophilus]